MTDSTERFLGDIGPDLLFNSAVAEKRKRLYKTIDCNFEKVEVEESAFGIAHASYYEETWWSSARKGDRLPQLLQGQRLAHHPSIRSY